ncbi:helix-turn-helix transcriptional regulator [Verrucosispora sp. WMMD573]|uniref:helix-turn-helix domain-containing protein n=1 Tax=Verrucosispora sp. WMMD573 TaxID=3015149 RepID=UPI00248B3A11|nr:helix-turn-helix transcriptional regulator [Verrucosispora sp. WMMD573]WBB54150.1 helix-turn-helix transcriptional regulator [Verrucosispora sp. WMMD573]
MGISPSEYLLRELRRRRAAAGLTQAQLGERVFCSDSQVSAIETGTKPPTLPYLTAVDKALDTGGYFATLWDELVKGDAAPIWLRELIQIEREATALRWYEHSFVPGLLQTEAYARAVFRAAGTPLAELDQRVAARLERQAVLARDPAPQLFVVLDEMVLRRACGGPDVMGEQVEHLLSCAEQPHIRLQVVPLSAGIYPGLAGAFILADLPDGMRAGYVDNQLAAQIAGEPDSLASLGLAWDAVRGEALPLGQTLDVLKEAAKTWTT